ncbi:chloramphenicol acetyltransferase [Pseudoalteromonas sp. A601]|uniref:CatA-like O-acetyltransferase n=1 Tax=Pseudoalteromonas sp. A601 TaxID=1967839 RepID=UPI000B3CE363|nr:CatA-like O-acetyltransferase [Pseudoalteromonas sp. A601]OUS68667.1 chloramphenicol acetyltransferase [Pseudoalteromonas sp. A601]
MTPIDLNNWPRAQHFELFKSFTQPYFNVCIQLDVQQLYQYCKSHQHSFFQSYIFLALRACHQYQPMQLRIVDDKPIQLQSTRASVVELAANDTFRFSYFNAYDDFSTFAKHAHQVSESTKQQSLFSSAFAKTEGQADLIHISVLPWLDFTSFSHAHHQGTSLGIPKLVFGKYNSETGKIPLSIDVHHALMDGLHVARFVDCYTECIKAYCKK